MLSPFNTEPELTVVVPKEKIFHYLDSLKDGKVASQFFVDHSIQAEFGVSKRAATRLYHEWMRSLG